MAYQREVHDGWSDIGLVRSKLASQQSPSLFGSPGAYKLSVEENESPFTQRKFSSLARSPRPME